MSNDQQHRSAAQRKQVKFSGLVQTGVIAPIVQTEDNPQFGITMPAERADVSDENITNIQSVQSKDRIAKIPVTLVDDSPYQSREQYKAEEIDELASAMEWDSQGSELGQGKGAGQQEPIIVRKVDERYELIAGHRRIRAFRTRGWPVIKAAIVERTDHEAELATMVHNEGRQNLCDYEKAKLYKRAIDGKFAKTQAEVAVIFATKQDEVSRRIGMFKLPGPILSLLEEQNDLFSAYTADSIRDLVKDFPGEVDVIKKAVERLKDGAKENSIKGWVTQTLSKSQVSQSKRSKQKVITDPSGKQVFTASLEGRIISLKINAPDVNAEDTLLKIYEWLQNSTNSELKNE